MRKLVAISGAVMLCMGSVSSQAATRRHTTRHTTTRHATTRHMTPRYVTPSNGCYRWGEAGYTWYPFCLGPSWLYPHQRACRHGYCWYR